ncbi:MAG: hypothetical protein PHX83_02420 [Acidobacteriia bacterium]|nr:hypothetical protein [Terriglobia bacterium]
MLKEWLTQKTTIEEQEAKRQYEGKTFGLMHTEWERFKSKIIDGDELWEFSSPPETWERLAGREGLSIVRHGEVIHSIVTAMS